jgi:hypothetical protein
MHLVRRAHVVPGGSKLYGEFEDVHKRVKTLAPLRTSPISVEPVAQTTS